MRIDHYHHIVLDGPIEIRVQHEVSQAGAVDLDERLSAIERNLATLVGTITQMEVALKTELDSLESQVKENTNLEQSAVQLINGIADMIAASAGDKSRVLQLVQNLKDTATPLAAAIAANTPGATT